MLGGRSRSPVLYARDAVAQPHSSAVPRRAVPKAQDRSAYHLPPLSAALPPASLSAAAGPRRASRTDPTDMPLALAPPAAPPRPLVSSRALAGPVQMWPAVTSTRQRRRQKALESKSPLSLQLEGFIRREHQQYVREHPSCSRTDTLFIFREALATFVNHFSEYRGVLYLIRDEYEAALGEMTETAKRMQAEYLESQSDRGLHAMELMQLKESLNATISNQQAQLSVTQGLVHALRDQLTAAEHANSMLTLEMEQKKKTYVEAQQQVKLLSRAMIDETARTTAERERVLRLEREAQIQESRIKVMQGNIAELEDCLREHAYAAVGDPAAANAAGRHAPAALPRPSPPRVSVDPPAADGADSAVADGYSAGYVAQLMSQVDQLRMQLQLLATAEAPRTAAAPSPPPSPPPVTTVAAPPSSGVDVSFPIVRQWLRMEGIGEAEVAATDVIVPPGRCMAEEAGFLGVTHPVKHRHLSLAATLRLVEALWAVRAQPSREKSRLRDFFVPWLRTQAADAAEAKALGINLLETCQHNQHHPVCRALLLVLRGYLPEEVVHVCRRRLAELRLHTEKWSATLHDQMPFEDFFDAVREVCPEKSVANMLHLRFTVYHRCNATAEPMLVTPSELLDETGYFVKLFKQQWLQEVEAFTLRVVEGIREVADEKHNTVPLVKAVAALRSLDAAISARDMHSYFSQACQKPVIEVATADGSVMVHLDAMLARFRSTVLLYRRSPEDAVED